MSDISEVLDKYRADERFVTHKELHQIARGAVGLAEENDRLRDEVARLKRRNEELETAFRTLRDTHELVKRLIRVIEWFENSEEE